MKIPRSLLEEEDLDELERRVGVLKKTEDWITLKGDEMGVLEEMLIGATALGPQEIGEKLAIMRVTGAFFSLLRMAETVADYASLNVLAIEVLRMDMGVGLKLLESVGRGKVKQAERE